MGFHGKQWIYLDHSQKALPPHVRTQCEHSHRIKNNAAGIGDTPHITTICREAVLIGKRCHKFPEQTKIRLHHAGIGIGLLGFSPKTRAITGHHRPVIRNMADLSRAFPNTSSGVQAMPPATSRSARRVKDCATGPSPAATGVPASPASRTSRFSGISPRKGRPSCCASAATPP